MVRQYRWVAGPSRHRRTGTVIRMTTPVGRPTPWRNELISASLPCC